MNFTIDEENNITAHTSLKKARETGWDVFSKEDQFADIVGSGRRLVEIWNNLPGVKPVTRFTNRLIATHRIWKVLEGFQPGERGPRQAERPERTRAPGSGAFGADAGKREANRAAPRAGVASAHVASREKTHPGDKAPRAANSEKMVGETSKISLILTLLKRECGATSREVMAVTGWQPHSVRGFISGTLRKRMGLSVATDRTASRERAYSIRDCGTDTSCPRPASLIAEASAYVQSRDK